MADNAAAAAPAADEGLFSSANIRTGIRMIAIWGAINWLTGPNSPFRSKDSVSVMPPPIGSQNSVPGVPQPSDAVPPAQGGGGPAGPVTTAPVQVTPHVSLWPTSTLLDVHVQLSTDPEGNVDFRDTSLPSVKWEGVEYANTKWSYDYDTVWKVPASVQNNGSIWADLFITPTGASPNPADATFDAKNTAHVRKLITRYMPKVKVRAVKKLLGGSKDEAEEEVEEEPVVPETKEVMPIISYYHPNLTFDMVPEPGLVGRESLPEPLQKWIQVAHPGEKNAQGQAYYFPVVWANDFWLLREHMFPINETTPELPLRITLNPSAMWKFQILCSMDDSFQKQAAENGKPGDLDVLKQTLLDTNPILLITTALVSVLHMVFEMLAFTSDISHWRKKKELVGVSVRTILTNCFVQLVVLLYLIDNNENTSWMILFSQGMGLLIEAWKINKAVDIKIVPDATKLIGYKLDITDKHVLSEDELKTQEYDAMAFKWVGLGTAPFLVGYTIYSMIYNEHRGWYSFTISTLTSFVYMFGFVQLIPQLLINWKLKSVAHIPFKAMMFKFFATIVDDFFSFVIRMPLLHRLACFRDDVVFVILLYQMWIYKVDPTRANEYGQVLTEEEAAKLAAQNKLVEAEKQITAKKDAAAAKGAKKQVKETKKTK
ncbi:Cleft lip and palate associated transmembrane protein [Pseudohyphozyma bogoriensis]|nr:Cleft lip and palate associated transmembrane protein [Pseudohyphozyma bogoriensis]